jgi:peptidoglycan-associated lipoprotein
MKGTPAMTRLPKSLTRLTLTAAATLALTACVTTSYRWEEVPWDAPAKVTPPPPPAPVKEFAKWDRVYFATDKTDLRPASRDLLDKQAAWLTAHPNVTVRVEGNADVRGNAAYNQRLGQRRAEAVRDYLVNKGVSPQRILSVSYGDTQPIAQGRTHDALARNRNVHTIIVDNP